jgi:hypothetical protein
MFTQIAQLGSFLHGHPLSGYTTFYREPPPPPKRRLQRIYTGRETDLIPTSFVQKPKTKSLVMDESKTETVLRQPETKPVMQKPETNPMTQKPKRNPLLQTPPHQRADSERA